MRLAVTKRLELLFDDGGYQRIEMPKADVDPLKFRDRKRYIDRLKESQAASGVVANTTRAATSAHRMGMRVVVTVPLGRGGPGGF